MWICLFATIVLQTPSPAPAREVSLRSPDPVLAQDFTQIRGVRELADGRVLVSDRLDKGVVVADFGTNAIQAIGRRGRGPAEYQAQTALIAMPGDSTLLVDEGNSRLAVIGPDLKIHRSFTLLLPGVSFPIGARAVDLSGRFYLQIPAWILRAGPNDSLPVVRFDARAQRVDTITHVRGSTPRPKRGPALPVQRLPVTMAERIAHTRRFMENSLISGKNANERLTPLPAEMLEEKSIREVAERNPFAETKGPFTDATPSLSPEGTLWVERSRRLGEAQRWDVFDSADKVVAHVRLPNKRELAGLGRGTLYAVVSEDDGLQRLERYRRDVR